MPNLSPLRCYALVLAAGLSRRAGPENKLLWEWEGQAMIERVVQAALASRVDEVLVVVGHDAPAIREKLSGQPVNYVDCADFATGMGRSLAAGVAALPADADAVVVLLGDMPLVSSGHIDRLLGAFEDTEGRSVVAPTCEQRRGHPVIWPQTLFWQLRQLTGDIGGQYLLNSGDVPVLLLALEDPAVLTDFDTLSELACFRNS